MYLPEDNKQMFEILAELRLYAAMNAYTGLAEELDDALVLLQTEMKRQADMSDEDLHEAATPHPSVDQV
jgi:hypothetical protein